MNIVRSHTHFLALSETQLHLGRFFVVALLGFLQVWHLSFTVRYLTFTAKQEKKPYPGDSSSFGAVL